MESRQLFVTLWEDDANGPGHNKQNEKNIVGTYDGRVKEGIADINILLKPSFAKIANKAGPERDKLHEYYVTVNFNDTLLVSNNLNVHELENILSNSEDSSAKIITEKVQVKPKGVKIDKKEEVNAVSKIFTPEQNEKKSKDEKKNEDKCPNCNKPVTIDELIQIFTKADTSTLQKVAEIYSKNMMDLTMNTCWNKAHFFAQALIESGIKLNLHKGELMNYLADDLYKGRWSPKEKKYKIIFSYFKTHKEEAYKYGRIEEIRAGKKVIIQKANSEMIANLAYGPKTNKGKELGNLNPTDGWDFRGKGLLQLTGRAAYEFANKYTIKEGYDIIANSNLVSSDVCAAVLSSMAFWKWKKINQLAKGSLDTKKICTKVGLDVTLKNGTTAYQEKQLAFTNVTSKIFDVYKCSS